MGDTLDKLKQIAQQANDFPKFPIKIHVPSITAPLANHYNTFNPQTVLALLELLELYKHSRFMSYGESIAFIEKEAALITKIEESIK